MRDQILPCCFRGFTLLTWIMIAVIVVGLDSQHASGQIIATADASLQSGTQVVGHVNRGQSLDVMEVRGDWIRVRVSGIPNAWIQRKFVSERSASKPLNRGSRDEQLRRAQQLINRVDALLQQEKAREALPLAREAVAIRTAVLGEDEDLTVGAVSYLGGVAHALGDYSLTRQCYQRQLTFCQRVHGERNENTLTARNNLAAILMELGEYEAARANYAMAASGRREVLGESHTGTISSMLGLSGALAKLRRSDEARKECERAVNICKHVHGMNNKFTATAIGRLGGLCLDAGDFQAARRHQEESLEIYRRVLGEKHTWTAASYQNLGATLDHMGDSAGARAMHERSMDIRVEVLGYRHPETAHSYYNLGLVYQGLGNYGSARLWYKMAAEVRTEALGPKNPETLEALVSLGSVMDMLDDPQEAKRILLETLDSSRSVFGERHPRTATAIDSVSNFYERHEDYITARKYAEQSLALRREIFGAEHLETAKSMESLALLMRRTGNYSEAIDLQQRVVSIRNNVLGDLHPNVARSLQILAGPMAATGQWTSAAKAMHQAQQISRQYSARVLPTLLDQEQQNYLWILKGEFHANMTLAWQRRDDPRIRQYGAEWLVNMKSIAQEATAQQIQWSDGEPDQLRRELRVVRSDLARLQMAIVDESQRSAHQQQLEARQLREAELVREIADSSLTSEVRDDRWIPIQNVRDAMDEDALLIDMARIKVFNFHATSQDETWLEDRYVAWIIPPASQGEIEVIDLGKAERVDEAVESCRTTLQIDPNTLAQRGEQEVEAAARETLMNLSSMILSPLESHLPPQTRLILSPEASLWLVPWSALVTQDGNYLVESHEIRYVTSGRDLVSRQAHPPAQGSPVILANPDYDLSLASAERELADTRATSTQQALRKAVRLPATATEARAVKPSIDALSGKTARLLMDGEATERAFNQLSQPEFLVFCTHGFFLQDQTIERQRDALQPEQAPVNENQSPQNPLLRCGLLLAGCNQNTRGTTSGSDDGILTGLEIVASDLRGTKLVVLSACETGIGKIRNGEGVAGLRQAFQLAGAESVMATLWQIPDRETARLMNDFFQNLADGKAKSTALREAQLERIQSRRTRGGAAHPFFWAAFTLTGRGQ